MKKATLEEMKEIQIQILDVVTQFCDEHDIKYWLDGGTLLGAVRHNGYIPWDDDIDIGMLRPDFDRFIREFNGYNERYVVCNVEVAPEFTYPFAKVLDIRTLLFEPDEKGNKLSINIDVFVYDNAPGETRALQKMFSKRDLYRDLNGCRTSNNHNIKGARWPVLSILIRIVLRLFPKNYFALKVVRNAQKYNNVYCSQVGNFLGWAKFVCDKDVFNTFIEHEFEGKEYKIPGGYDKWLTSFYGDYMTPPPIEKQVSHHEFIAYIEE